MGVEYTVYENYVTSSENSKYAIASSSSSGRLIVEGLENFTVESGSQGAILVDNKGVPYFRKGGVNLDYQLKIVGFAKSRAISSFKVTSKSNKYKSYTSEDTVSDGETVNLTAPVQGDTQTVTVELSDGGLVVVPDITINNTGDKMGTIAVNEDNKYTLKVSGLVSEEDRTQGYLYKGNKYPLTLKLVNTSDLDIYSSSLKVYSKDSALNVSSAEGKDLSGILVSKMYPESEFETQLYVEYAGNISGYVDSGLTVEIKNGNTGDVWEDYIPLRFFEGLVPLSFSCESVSDNDSALNGFVIYPDGNSKFFAVRGGGKKTLYVPKFKNGDEYILAFSGATTARYLSDSTEVFYGVNLGSATAKVLATSGEIIEDYINFGGENHSMVNRCELSQDNLTSGFFEAHLSSGEADYYGFKLDSYSSVSAEKAEFDTNYHITYENPKANTVILTWTLESGKEISYFDIYRNGMKISERSINSSEENWTDVNCKPGTHYVYTFVNPQDNLVSVSNTLGLTTSYLKYTSSDIDGHYDDEEGGIIFYFKQFTDIPSYLTEYSKYRLLTDEFTDIIVYRNGQKLFNLSDFDNLFYDQQSIACYQEYGFYMIFSGDGNVSMNYTPKDNSFGFIDMSAQQGVPYTYYFRDSEGHKISVDQKMKG